MRWFLEQRLALARLTWLLVERGVTPGTARGYVDCVRPFVATRAQSQALEFTALAAADVAAFVLASCPGRAVGSAKLIVCALRSLLRWLHLTGAVPVSLAAAVPRSRAATIGPAQGSGAGSAAPAAAQL
jgi:site-specific recombinase XerC